MRREVDLRDLCQGPAATNLTARRSWCKRLTLKASTTLVENMIQNVFRAVTCIGCLATAQGYPALQDQVCLPVRVSSSGRYWRTSLQCDKTAANRANSLSFGVSPLPYYFSLPSP